MLILIALVLAAIPLAAILYPFIRGGDLGEALGGETAENEELSRMWDSALAGLRSAELERSIGILGEEDYRTLRDQYMTEAALALKALDVEAGQEAELLMGMEEEVKRVREGLLGQDEPEEEK